MKRQVNIFIGGKGRGVDKTFSFKIRYSVESSGFTVNGKSVDSCALHMLLMIRTLLLWKF